jgi:DnaJ-class molecular chaperone
MADLKSNDYYENLGVARNATEDEIKKAYVGVTVCWTWWRWVN